MTNDIVWFSISRNTRSARGSEIKQKSKFTAIGFSVCQIENWRHNQYLKYKREIFQLKNNRISKIHPNLMVLDQTGKNFSPFIILDSKCIHTD